MVIHSDIHHSRLFAFREEGVHIFRRRVILFQRCGTAHEMREMHPLPHRPDAEIFHQFHFLFNIERFGAPLLHQIAHSVKQRLIGDAVPRIQRDSLFAAGARAGHESRDSQADRFSQF